MAMQGYTELQVFEKQAIHVKYWTYADETCTRDMYMTPYLTLAGS